MKMKLFKESIHARQGNSSCWSSQVSLRGFSGPVSVKASSIVKWRQVRHHLQHKSQSILNYYLFIKKRELKRNLMLYFKTSSNMGQALTPIKMLPKLKAMIFRSFTFPKLIFSQWFSCCKASKFFSAKEKLNFSTFWQASNSLGRWAREICVSWTSRVSKFPIWVTAPHRTVAGIQ